jgi:hypothetical protein
MSGALMQTAAARGKLMELIAAAERPHDKNYQERAFMVGDLCKTPDFLKSGKKMAISIRFVWVF